MKTLLQGYEMSLNKMCHIMGVENPYDDIPVRAISMSRIKPVEDWVCFAFKNWRVDNYANVEYAINNGAVCVVSDKKVEGIRCIVVDNPMKAFYQVAAYCVEQMKTDFITVVGSIGKTSTKEMIWSALSQCLHCDKSPENLNSADLAARHVFDMKEEFEVYIQEGTVHDIEDLSYIMKPRYAVVTNIGLSHSELFGSREDIFNEKIKTASYLREDGALVLNIDDSLLYRYSKEKNSIKHIITYGIECEEADYRAENIIQVNDHIEFDICFHGEMKHCEIASLGKHNVLNALAAFAIADDMKLDKDSVIAGIKKWMPKGVRQNIIDVDGVKVFADCFNASSSSTMGALSTLEKVPVAGRRIAVLADILELGRYSVSEHEKIGVFINDINLDVLILYGPLAGLIKNTVKNEKLIVYTTNDRDELKEIIRNNVKTGDVVLFKGSHGMALDEIIDRIYGTNYSRIVAYHNGLWMRLKKMGLNISQYLIQNGIHSVALYGFTEVGETLADILTEEGFKVEYIIDNRIKAAPETTYKYKLISDEDEFSEADLLVLCRLNDKDDLVEKCSKKYAGKIAHYKRLEELIRMGYTLD